MGVGALEFDFLCQNLTGKIGGYYYYPLGTMPGK